MALPKKVYACVLEDGTTTEHSRKELAIKDGDATGQSYTVLSPRGYEVHYGGPQRPETKPTKPATKSGTVLAQSLVAGQTVVGTRKRESTRRIGRVAVGAKHVTVWDESGRDFGYWPVGTKVEVVS